MTGTLVLARHLLRRLLRPRRTLGLVALASVAGLGAWVGASQAGPGSAPAVFHTAMASANAATLPIAILVVGVATLREERDGGTLPYLFLKPVARPAFAAAAWLAATGAALVVALSGWVVALIASVSTTGSGGPAVAALSAYVAAAVTYTAVFVPLGYLVPRAILVGLGYIFVWEGVVASLVPGLAQTSIWRIALSIYAAVTTLPRDALSMLGPVAPGAGGALLKVAGIVVASLAVLTWALRSRDAL